MNDPIDNTPGDGGNDYFGNILNEVKTAIDPENNPAPVAEPAKQEPAKSEPAPKEEPAKKEEPAAQEAKDGADKDDIDKIDLPQNASAKAAESFNHIKATAKGYKAKMEAAEKLVEALKAEFGGKETEYTGKIRDFETQVAEAAALKAREAEFEEAQKELALSRVEGTVEYKRTIREPLVAIEARITEIAKDSEASKEALLDAIAERDPAKQRAMLKEILPVLDEVDRLEVARAASDARVILDRKDQIEADAVTAAKELKERQEKESVKAKETATKAYASAVDHAASELGKRLPFMALNDGETADGILGKFVKDAKETDFSEASPNTKATAALSMLMFERAVLQIQKLTEENKSLNARIAEARTADPAVNTDSPPPPRDNNGDGLVGSVEALLGLQKSHGVLTRLGS